MADTEAVEHKPTRDEIRSNLLGKKPQAKSEVITIFGSKIEVRQPPLEDILRAREIEDPVRRTMDMFVRYAYVPDTDERVFEDADISVVMKWPFGEDIMAFQQAISRLTGVNIGAAEEDLQKDPTEGQ